MPRRRRSFFFNNKHKKLLTNTTANVKTSRTTSTAGLKLEGFLDANGNHIDMGSNNITDTKVGQWDTAYGWGNHASAGYSTTTYSNSDVDSHLNQSNPTSGYVLSWNGSDYAWVAQSTGFSGNYNDLTNKPTIPTNNNQLTNGAGYLTSSISTQISFPSAIANRPVLAGGFIGMQSSDADVDIWGISETYYPSHATAGNAWGIRWASTPNEIQFVGNGENKLRIDLDTDGSIIYHGGGAAWGETTQGTTIGSFHLGPDSTNHYGNAITFGAEDSSSGSTAQAGIYIRSDGSYGTKMYISTTDSYATGSKTAISINQVGTANFVRQTPTVAGSTMWHAGNDGSGSGLDADTLDGHQLNGGSGSVGEKIFNNQGRGHANATNFNDTSLRAGVNYLQGGTNGPTGSGQWYGFRLGLGSSYGTQTGTSGHYASEFYWGRKGQTSNNYYIYTRDLENGSWGSWVKMNAGYADSAGSVAWSNVTGAPAFITNGANYNVNNVWLRENGDNADVKLYGNSRQMTFRTDGVSGGTGGHTGYPFRWTYGGDASGNTEMLLNTSGQLWLANYGWLHDAFLRKNATDTQTNTINMNGYFVGGADGHRHKGIFGNYNSYRINNIWSMGTAYVVNSNGSSFGNLYGMAYTYHNRVYTSNTMGGYHQMVWCQNGTPNCALGSNIWTSGNVTAYSDIRVKENLERIPDALEKVKKLNGYTFDRTDIETDNEGNTARKRQTGVVAQEVLEVLPEVVTGNEDNPDGHLSVAYGNMVGLLIEAIKEQQEQIEELKAKLQ